MDPDRERALWRLLAMCTAVYAAVNGSRVLMVLSAIELGAPPTTIGLLTASYALVPLLLALAGGRMIDRIGVRGPMIAGSALLAAALLAPAFRFALPVLFAAALLVGLGQMAYHMAMQKTVGDIGAPESRARNFNLFTLSFSVSGIAGPGAAGLLIDAVGHRLAFVSLALPAALVLLVCVRWRFESHLPALPAEDHLAASPAGGLLELLGNARIRQLVVVSVVMAACSDVFAFVIPLYGSAVGLSASAIGTVLAAFGVGTLLVRLAMPLLMRRVMPTRLVVFSMLLSIAVYTVLPFADAASMLLVLAVLLGAAPGIAQPVLLASLHTASPPGRVGEAAGLRMALVSGLQLALPIGLGALAGLVGLKPLFAGYALAATAVTARLWGRRLWARVRR